MCPTLQTTLPRVHAATRCRSLLTRLAVLGCMAMPAYAAIDTGLDVVLVIDTSASMRSVENNAAGTALAKHIIASLGTQDRVSIVSFSSGSDKVLDLTNNRNRAQQALQGLTSRGLYSNLPDALETAGELLQTQHHVLHQPVIILISDGNIDLHDPRANFEGTQRLINNIIPKLHKRGVRVYAISSDDDANNTLLRLIAEDTGGDLYLVAGGQGQRIVNRMIENVRNSTDASRREYTFTLAPGTAESTVIISPNGGDVFLISPHNDIIARGDSRPNLHWKNLQDHVLVLLEKPQAGLWRIVSRQTRNVAFFNDLAIKSEINDGTAATAGTELKVAAWVEDRGVTFTGREFIRPASIEVDITMPDGTSARLPLNDLGEFGDTQPNDAIFGGTVTLTHPGTHRFKFSAGNLFFFETAETPLDVTPSPYAQEAAERYAANLVAQEQTAARLKAEERARRSLLTKAAIAVILFAGLSGWYWKRKRRGALRPDILDDNALNDGMAAPLVDKADSSDVRAAIP